MKGLFIVMYMFSLQSFAQITVTVDFEQEGRSYSKYIFGKNNSFSGDPNGPLSAADLTRLEDSGITIFRENGGNNSTKYNWKSRMSSHPDWYNNVYSHSWDYKAQSIADHFPDRLGMFGLQLIGKAAKTNEHNFNDWEYNQAQWWDGVHQNLAGGGLLNASGGGQALTDGDPELYLMDWPADSTVGIFDHWFDEDGLNFDKNQFAYWCMDNEPSIWNGTHDDIATDEESAEDYIQKYFKVAKAARAKFPMIKLIGPILANEWQWYNWHDQRIAYNGNTYSTLEYFILRIGEEQKATGIRLLDVLAIHFYPGNQDISKVVQFHRVFFDETYDYPDANGVKTINGGWEPSFTKEYIFKRVMDWMDTYLGEDHHVGLGVTETGVAISDPNAIAVWYASMLGEFMKNNVEVFTPWSWQPSMWEVVNLFTEYTEDLYFESNSTDEEIVSAYTTASADKEKVTSLLVNRSTTKSMDIELKIEGRNINKATVKAYLLSNLPSAETFVSDTDNAVNETTVDSGYRTISFSLPPLSIMAVVFNTLEGQVVTGADQILVCDQLNIYPNPNQGEQLFIDGGTDEIKYLKLFSINGKTLKSITNPSHIVELGNIPNGLYFVRISTDKGIIDKKLIINK